MKLSTILTAMLLIAGMPVVGMAADNAKKRPRDLGIKIGMLPTGENNAITDVKGVKVGQVTINKGDSIRTGVTAILPYDGNIFKSKVPAEVYLDNGFGKMTGYSQVKELGKIETPIVLTNTMSIAAGLDGIIDYTLSFEENGDVRSVNGIVGETNDGGLNDIRGRHVTSKHVLEAIKTAKSGKVEEGCARAGAGTIAFNFKGGIGTASRVLPKSLGGYPFQKQIESADGSIMMIVATDAPVDARNLERIAKRAMMGPARTGGIASKGSGDYVIAFSTDESLRTAHNTTEKFENGKVLRNDEMSPLFLATIEATEEAIINPLFAAITTKGVNGREVQALPVDKVMELMKKHNKIEK